MIEEMTKMGASKTRLIAKIAGGACMFQSAMPDPAMNIGQKNLDATKQHLAQEKIAIIAEDTGKDYGRTLQFNTVTGKLVVRSAKFGIKEI